MNPFVLVSLRQKAVFIPAEVIEAGQKILKGSTSLLIANLAKLGFGVSEPLLEVLNQTTPTFQTDLLLQLRKVMGIDKNWTPLVKSWNEPTRETFADHIITWLTNIFGAKGTTLACGHTIPAGTFPLERYNGCPFCGMPFELDETTYSGQGSKLKVLELWREKELHAYLNDLLSSKTPLDATQLDSLKILLSGLTLPADVNIGMKETLMAVIDIFVAQNQTEKAQVLFSSPTDILRYLWYKHTGFLQIIEPKTIIKRAESNSRHIALGYGKTAKAKTSTKAALKLKYSRKECLMVAGWLNNLDMDAENICEIMHPKRSMWVRFIRALRLAEYSKRAGFEKLKAIMDVFYNECYEVWQGRVNHFRLRAEEENTFKLLKQRPGLFARSLFANMLWFGKDSTLEAFSAVVDKVPARLVFTLQMYAESYFSKENMRTVKPLGGTSKNIPANKLLSIYDEEGLKSMKEGIAELCMLAMLKRFAAIPTSSRTIYIDPMLYKMPVSIGDRSEHVQDLPAALMGTRFEVEGDTVRLFMQWGKGLPAQHMDMDLSCYISFAHTTEICSFSNLVATGCKHSGDIRSIPDEVGTAEYMDINIHELIKAGAKYVTFTCNAYSHGSITPNLVVGWMNSSFPMKISEKSGVAYDPSCIQHQVRITSGLTKGLVFGVLDVVSKEIIWLEMPFYGQIAQNLDLKAVESMLAKLQSKLSIGHLLGIKAQAQNLQILDTADADEVYSKEWAINSAAVTRLLVD